MFLFNHLVSDCGAYSISERDEVWLVLLEPCVSSAGLLMHMRCLVVTGDCLFDIECTAHDSSWLTWSFWFVCQALLPWFGCVFAQFICVSGTGFPVVWQIVVDLVWMGVLVQDAVIWDRASTADLISGEALSGHICVQCH